MNTQKSYINIIFGSRIYKNYIISPDLQEKLEIKPKISLSLFAKCHMKKYHAVVLKL